MVRYPPPWVVAKVIALEVASEPSGPSAAPPKVPGFANVENATSKIDSLFISPSSLKLSPMFGTKLYRLLSKISPKYFFADI